MELDINLDNVRKVLDIYNKIMKPHKLLPIEKILDDLEEGKYCEYALGSRIPGFGNPKLFLQFPPHSNNKFEPSLIPNVFAYEKELIQQGKELINEFNTSLEKAFSYQSF